MAGGMYTAMTGMVQRMEELERIAADLANVGTSGYKREQSSAVVAQRLAFAAALDSAIDVVGGRSKIDFRPGVTVRTGRDLDVALEGPGFFAIETPAGTRYTRNGAFERSADGRLVHNGDPVLDEEGRHMRIGEGLVTVERDGSVRVDGDVAGRLRVVTFASDTDLVRESGSRFRAIAGAQPAPADTVTTGGSLEQSNVTIAERMVALTNVTRSFEGLQRGMSVLMNDVDGRAISELGRRTP